MWLVMNSTKNFKGGYKETELELTETQSSSAGKTLKAGSSYNNLRLNEFPVEACIFDKEQEEWEKNHRKLSGLNSALTTPV